MKSSLIILLIIISFINIINCEDISPDAGVTPPDANQDTPQSTSAPSTSPTTPTVTKPQENDNNPPIDVNDQKDAQNPDTHQSTSSTAAPSTSSTTEPPTTQQEVANVKATLDTDTENTDSPKPTLTAPEPKTISQSEAEEMTGGGVWSSIGLIAVVICGCICLERLYSSCKKVYQKRTGRYGFSRLHNQTFNEFEDEDDDEEMDENLGDITTRNRNTKNSDQDSV